MKLSDHVDLLRNLIEAAFDKQFARLGIGKIKLLDIEKLPEEVRPKRLCYEEILNNHIGETGDYEHAREKLIDELTFTLFNRLAAVKVMEAAALFPPVLTRQADHGDRSFGHKAWLEINPDMRSEELEGIREYIKAAFNELGETLPLYNKSFPYALLPDAISLNEIIDTFNAVEKDTQVGADIWQSDDVLGWMYESYNKRKKKAHKDSGDKTEYNKVSLQSQVYTPRWVVQFLVENSLGKLYLEMYPDSGIKRRYKIANAGEKNLEVRSQEIEEKTKDILSPNSSILNSNSSILNSNSSILNSKKLPDIKLIDPACGSGNFLLYAFDFFYELYVDQIDNYGADYDEKDIPRLIIENNLHGIDLDDRAVQLAQLGLYIKAKKKHRTIGSLAFKVVSSDFYLPEYENVKHIFENSGDRRQKIDGKDLTILTSNSQILDSDQLQLIREIWTDLQYAYKFGSLIRLDEKLKAKLQVLEARQSSEQPELFTAMEIAAHKDFAATFFSNLKTAVEQYAQSHGNTFLTSKTRDAITFLELLTAEYDVATTNPPYTDSADFGPELKEFIEDNYKKPFKFHTNLYASFIKRCYELISTDGKIAMIHPHTFMFIKTFEDVRKFIIDKCQIDAMVDFGLDRVNLFGPGILLDATFYVLSKGQNDKDGLYFNLSTNLQEKFKKDKFLEALNDFVSGILNDRVYKLEQSKLKIIKSWPFIYWISDEFREKFKKESVKDLLKNCQGLATANNNRFLRFWWELSPSDEKINKEEWVYYAKGGPYKKWSGNLWLMVNWKSDGRDIKNYTDEKGRQKSRPQNEAVYFKEGITYSASGSKGPSYRLLPKGCIFDVGGSSIFPINRYKNNSYILAFFNSPISNYVIECLNPTVNKQVGDVERVPFVIPDGRHENIIESLSKRNVAISTAIRATEFFDGEFNASPLLSLKNGDWKSTINKSFNRENHFLTQVLINEAIINEKVFEVYDLTEHDKAMVLAKEGESIGGLPVLAEARTEYLEFRMENLAENEHKKILTPNSTILNSELSPNFYLLDSVIDFINNLSTKKFTPDEVELITSGFPTLYQSNNDLEEFCIRHQVNPINVWYWFKQSNVIPQQRMHTLAMEFLVDMVREILLEDEDGIIPLVPNAGEKILLDRIEEKFREKGFSPAQYSSFDTVLGRPIHEYLNKFFFAELSDHLNLFMYLPKTPFIWHLSSGPEQGFDCYIIIYKWSRDKLMRLRSVYIEHRERALVNRQSDLAGNDSADAQNEKERIFRQLKEIEAFKKKIDELLAEGYNPILDDGVGKNIAPLQKKGLVPYEVLNAGQLKKYLNAEW